MKCISIRQPWAWLIIRPDLLGAPREEAINLGEIKDIENRTWSTKHRGPLLIHAAQGMTRKEYDSVVVWLGGGVKLPPFEELRRGGIIGAVNVVGCVIKSESIWFMGPVGFVLAGPRPLPFTPYKGALGLFDVPESAFSL